MAEKFDEFLEEVEHDIRQEKLINLWKKYGKLIVSGIVGILVVVGSYNVWQHVETQKRAHMAEKLIAAQDEFGKGEMEKALTILSSFRVDSHSLYQSLALFQKAGILLQAGQPTQALAIYEQLSANPKLDLLWRDLATLLGIMATIDQPGVKTESLLNRLSPLTSDQNPWRYFAKEMKGVLLQQKGDFAQAAEVFASLVQDNQTPSGISMRSRLMVQILSANLS